MRNIVFIIFRLLYLVQAFLLFGWFGFNAGSSLKADGLAIHAFMTTAVAAASGMLSWMLMDVWKLINQL